jgi:hypothetical protein
MWLFVNNNVGEVKEFQTDDEQSHDKVPNLKLVMNPEGKLHDWSDLPEEDVPEQIVMVGNPEIAQALANNLNTCQGRGKTGLSNSCSKQQQQPSFAGSFRHVFDSRRGMFEQSTTTTLGTRPNNISTTQLHNNTTTLVHHQPKHKLTRSKTLPDIPQLEDPMIKNSINDEISKRPHLLQPPSPVVPKRSSSKQFVAKYNQSTCPLSFVDEQNSLRRPLRSFFLNDT